MKYLEKTEKNKAEYIRVITAGKPDCLWKRVGDEYQLVSSKLEILIHFSHKDYKDYLQERAINHARKIRNKILDSLVEK